MAMSVTEFLNKSFSDMGKDGKTQPAFDTTTQNVHAYFQIASYQTCPASFASGCYKAVVDMSMFSVSSESNTFFTSCLGGAIPIYASDKNELWTSFDTKDNHAGLYFLGILDIKGIEKKDFIDATVVSAKITVQAGSQIDLAPRVNLLMACLNSAKLKPKFTTNNPVLPKAAPKVVNGQDGLIPKREQFEVALPFSGTFDTDDPVRSPCSMDIKCIVVDPGLFPPLVGKKIQVGQHEFYLDTCKAFRMYIPGGAYHISNVMSKSNFETVIEVAATNGFSTHLSGDERHCLLSRKTLCRLPRKPKGCQTMAVFYFFEKYLVSMEPLVIAEEKYVSTEDFHAMCNAGYSASQKDLTYEFELNGVVYKTPIVAYERFLFCKSVAGYDSGNTPLQTADPSGIIMSDPDFMDFGESK